MPTDLEYLKITITVKKIVRINGWLGQFGIKKFDQKLKSRVFEQQRSSHWSHLWAK